MKEKKTKRKHNSTIDNYSLSEILYLFLSRWYWFILSILITTGYSVYKIVTTKPVYTRYTMIHIESDNKGNLSEQMENFANMGIAKSSTNAHNEIYTFKAPETIKETTRRLKLYTEYYSVGTFYSNDLYGETLPATVNFCDIDIEEQASLDMDIDTNGKFRLYNFKSANVVDSTYIDGDFNNDSITLVYTPLGDIILERNKVYTPEDPMTINVRQIGINGASAKLGSKLHFGTNDNSKANDIINISFSYAT